MRRLIGGLLGGLLLGPAPGFGAQVEGVRFAESLEWRGTPLALQNAALMRYRWVIKVYVAGLYLGEGVSLDRALDDVPRRLEIEYFYGFNAEQFAESMLDGIRKNVDEETFEALRPEIERFGSFYRSVLPGDRYALTYVPGVGTTLELNGERLGELAGAEFSRALFSIWLGPEPFDARLKRDLLRATGG